MPLRKTAIAVPEDLLDRVDRAARERGVSRSRYITDVLRVATRARRDAEITRRLNALFSEEATAREQRAVAETLESVSSEWSEEGW